MSHSLFRRIFCLLVVCFASGKLVADPDLGKQPVANLDVSLFFASDGDISLAGERAKSVDKSIEAKFRKEKHLGFKQYRLLGKDRQPVLRSYENWASPLKPSEDIMVSFEPQGSYKDGAIRLDLELWQQHKKVLKASPTLQVAKPLYILGPQWRGGRIIISVTLSSL